MTSVTEATGRVPLSTKFFYGFGSISEGTMAVVFNFFLLFYYNNVLGLSGTLAGMAIFADAHTARTTRYSGWDTVRLGLGSAPGRDGPVPSEEVFTSTSQRKW